MDVKDYFRYCKWPLRMLNKHMAKLIVRSWLLAPDESMSTWRGDECAQHLHGTANQSETATPLKQFVERDPEPLGLEIKTTVNGLCGVIILGEITPPAKEHRNELEF
eukprot:6193175-Pleurochrysis_carterae.AAC.2